MSNLNLNIIQEIPQGLCQCGCGAATNLASQSDTKRNLVRGEPRRFLMGHNTNGRFGEKNPAWKGGKTISDRGYVSIKLPADPRANAEGYVREHINVATRALGKPLPPLAQLHHIDGNKSNNRNDNLVICQDDKYHKLLHLRARALRACGNASYRKCWICKAWDNPDNLKFTSRKTYHKACDSARSLARYHLRKTHSSVVQSA